MTARPERASRVGEVVGGKYRIVRMLAEGGMGVVYEAQHTVVKRRFAVKFLRPDLAERRDILTRFQREAEAAGALESENVAASVDFGIMPDGAPYIVMEYLVGESLDSLLEREGRLPVARAADLAAQASRGIQIAHTAGIVHRDLKPQNLFVCRRQDGTDLLKVLDFGVAKLQAINEMGAATRTGTILGTVAYMSPEQARGDKIVDHRADVYALGAILYELCSRHRPHPGESNNAILHHISAHPAVPLESVQPGLPDGLVEIVACALASDPAARPPSAEAFAQALAPFAKREVWPAPELEGSGPMRVALTSTMLAPGAPVRPTPPASSLAAVTADERGPAPPPPARSRVRVLVASAMSVAVVAVVAVLVLPAAGSRKSTIAPPPRARAPEATRTLAPSTRFFAPMPSPPARQQIAALETAKDVRDAALLTAMAATPHAVWFEASTPAEVQSAVHLTVIRATHEARVPVLVAYNIPFRDCARYAAGGAADVAAYAAWIDGFAKGIGNERVVVLLEPDSLGLIPYNTRLDGSTDDCKPTVTDAQGKTIPAPGATARDRYALIASSVDTIESQAPNAAVYLDGTHSAWLTVGEIAYRLAQAGVERAQGFAVNTSNYQPTPEEIKYGTWVSKCLAYASDPLRSSNKADAYRACPGPRAQSGSTTSVDWSRPERWYADNVDRPSKPLAGGRALTHFVVDTGRNGRGRLAVTPYAVAPYNQPESVINGLRIGDWCNPPGTGLGLRPTANTGVPLVDAFLWVSSPLGPGGSDASCDIAGGSRDWDYSKYNPWGLTGEGQKHFDPLWGMVDPAMGEWFPEQALQLARNADPPLQGTPMPQLAQGADAPGPTAANDRPASVADVGRYAGARPAARRRSSAQPSPLPAAPATPSASAAPAGTAPSVPITFDQQNPYK